MIDYRLQFADEAAAKAALPQFIGGESGNDWLLSSHEHALVPIGPIMLAPPEVDTSGNIVVPPVMDERFHVNIRSATEIDISAEYIVNPTNPRFVWA